MRRLMVSVLALGIALGLTALPAAGQGRGQESSTLGFGAGIFDTSAYLDEGDFDAFEAGLLWRGPTTLPLGLGTMAGLSANEDGALWAYYGLRRPFRVRGCWEAGLTFAPAYYDQGDSKDLGHELEFRSGLEVNCVRAGGSSIGFEVYHLSNAGISDVNPGANSFWVVFSVPLGRE